MLLKLFVLEDVKSGDVILIANLLYARLLLDCLTLKMMEM